MEEKEWCGRKGMVWKKGNGMEVKRKVGKGSGVKGPPGKAEAGGGGV